MRIVWIAFVVALVATSASAAPLENGLTSTLRREPLLTPETLGDGQVDGLQYADPTEGLALVDPPAPTNGGSAQLSYPLIVPHGRGLTPELALEYDSGAENGWVGLGWDLSVGEISVDTEFGAPRFLADKESESYLLDGVMLVPNALGETWAPRQRGDRADYTRKVETEYEQIIRHEVGNGGPDDYYWEVRDKQGNVRWYGGHPDDGGPDGAIRKDADGNPLTIDRSAIVTDNNGNAVRWLLSAERDVGVNMMRYHYETVKYRHGASGWAEVASCTSSSTVVCASHTYLSRIDYTAGAKKSGHAEDPPYQVHFLRESDVRPAAALRKDPSIDATGGYLDLTIDRLARVEVRYGAPASKTLPDGTVVKEQPRTYDKVAVRYDLNYSNGAFGKSLLASVDQVGSDLTTKATHEFDYFDEVTNASGNYQGFAANKVDWKTADPNDPDGDLPARQLLTDEAEPGALGSSESNSAEGHAYIGFNPAVPAKLGSFGGSLQLGGGATEALAEWIDLNGDSLPDKVYRDPANNDVERDGPIRFRLNRSGPSGNTVFGPQQTVGGQLTRLSIDGNFGLQAAFEGYPGVSVAFGTGLDVTWGDAYFSDVNSDGLPDFVLRGDVYFNHLVNGIPTFDKGNSAATPVPIAGGTPAAVSVAEIDDIESDLAEQSPLVDTVRRWTAPYAGTVSISAPVTLSPANGTSVDGVRVAIQHEASELSTATLQSTGASAFTSPITRTVGAGEDIYFRVGSVDDGTNDELSWAPKITYTAITGIADITTVPQDVNRLSQTVFDAKNDFTLSGRPGSKVLMPLKGTVRFEATIAKSKVTTDDLTLVLRHNDSAVPGAVTIPASFVGNTPVSIDFAVAAPILPTEANPDVTPSHDSVTAHLAVDSPIDLTAISWNPTLRYISAVDAQGQPVEVTDPNGDPTIKMDVPPEIEQYPRRSPGGVSEPWQASAGDTYDARVTFNRATNAPAGTAVISVKRRNTPNNQLIAQQAVSIPAGSGSHLATLNLNLAIANGGNYWFDVTIRDPAVSDKVSLGSFVLRPDGATDATKDVTVPATLHWVGRHGIFPLVYRGWAVAGYNGNGAAATAPIDETAFTIQTNNLPTEIDEPTGFDDPNFDPPTPDRAYPYYPSVVSETVPGLPAPIAAPTWKGSRDNLAVTSERVRSSRLGSDSATLGSASGGSGRGVTRVGITSPSAALSFGLGPLGGSFGVSPSFGLVDFEDMNGDGYPDIITPSAVQYTTPRGGLMPTTANPGNLAVTNQDLTFAVTAGLTSGLVDLKGNVKGKTNANQGNAAGKGSVANQSGAGIGIGAEINAEWTSPNASGPADSPLLSDGTNDPVTTYGAQLGQTPQDPPSDTAPIQLALADVNGDGLPDRVFTTPNGVFVKYNLGYSFADAAVKLATGGFESQESYSGATSFGFSTPWADFGGGVALNWDADLSRYSWRDVNGDGILDQVHKINNTTAPTVAFGTGTGILAPVQYGTWDDVHVTDEINAGQQITFDRSTGIGGGFDFTIAIGPLCAPIPACYLIINPGASYQNGISSTEADLSDVDGDGYADALLTTDDGVLSVRTNKHGRTNLLEEVRNPIGGKVTLDYARYGNTVDHPDSVWALSQVDVADGRPGDGVDVTRTTFDYSGLRYDRLHRESLGFGRVDASERDASNNDLLRKTRYEYLNDNVFVAGLEKAVTVMDPDGISLRGTTNSWALRDVLNDGTPVPVELVTGLSSPASLGRSLAPLLRNTRELWHLGDAAGTVSEDTRIEFTYDDFGNVLTQRDLGELEDENDDVLATYLYSTCANATEADDPATPENEDIGCNDGTTRPSPLWHDDICYTWVNLPVKITVTNGKTGAGEVVYRERDGRPAVCNNNSVTHLEETIGDGEVALTELQYDDWGSYNRIVYPEGETGRRYAVEYTYDDDRHSDIAVVQEYDLDNDAAEEFLDEGFDETSPLTVGLQSTAGFDPISGRVSRRVDANDNATDYTYDALGRIASITSPHPKASAGVDLVTYEYFPGAEDAHAIARHRDEFNAGTIDTAVFVDGVGRVTQTKRDASLFAGAGQASEAGIVVSGGLRYDALGRPIEEFNPRVGTKALGVFDPAAYTGPVTTTDYDLYDLPGEIVEPGDRTTSIVYDYAAADVGGPVVFQTTSTAPNGRATVTYTDIREVVRAVDDEPVGAPALRTTYESDGFGQLRRVVDPAGNETTHTYDLLGRRTSTNTPDGGLVEYGFDADGKQISQITPNLRDLDEQISYRYELQRLTEIDYPGDTPDVSYSYGAAGAPDNGAGRLVRSEDGSRILTNRYSAAGEIVSQTAEMKTHQWDDSDFDRSKVRWTTGWTYDALGRIATLTYPDGERLTYDYDLGGLVSNVVGEEEGVDSLGQPTTWHYDYLRDRQYDEFFRARYDHLGNGATTERTYDPDTQWLSAQRTVSPNRTVTNAAYTEIQDLKYTYDEVGNPRTYRNELPAPQSNLFGGATSQEYTYDPYERIVSASGEWQQATGKVRRYTFALDYDTNGNVVFKSQRDVVRINNKDNVQAATTYSFTRSYAGPQPHQATSVGNTSYSYDANGNLLGVKDRRDRWIRQMTWDASDRMRSISDGPQVTDYKYDDTGQRTIERGPSGETLFVNPWVTIRNTNEMWKHIWAGTDRLAVQRDEGPSQELKQYFLHKDLQGSTNIVTDVTGNTFQHHEYFPTGEVWVDEKSTVFRTPYQYAGGYVDEVRKVISIGARFYDQNRELFYSPDPILTDDPSGLLRDPVLRAAYSYAGANPLRNVDPTGLEGVPVHVIKTAAQAERIVAEVAAYREKLVKRPILRARLARNLETSLPRGLVKLGLDFEKAQKKQDSFDRFQSKPLIEINFSEKTLKLSFGIGKRRKIGGDDAAAAPANSGTGVPGGGAGTTATTNAAGANATGASGGPNVGAAPPRPTSPAPTAPSARAAGSGGATAPTPPPRPSKPAPAQPPASGGTGASTVNRPDNGV